VEDAERAAEAAAVECEEARAKDRARDNNKHFI